MTTEEVPDDLIQAGAEQLRGTTYWTGYEPEHAEEQVREILAAVLPLYKRKLFAQGVFANLQRHLTALPDNTPPPPRYTVLVAAQYWEFDRWCDQNQRRRRDRTIIRIADGRRDAHRLQGILDFELVVLSEIPHHNEAMALISSRLRAQPGTDPSQ